MKVTLFISYYRDTARRKEIDYCLQENLKSIDHIFLLSEQDINIKHKKLTTLKLPKRPTVNDLFNLSKLYEGIKIISNSDIFFTPKEISKIKEIDYENRVIALTRWNIPEIGLPIFYNSHVSQDTWIFKTTPNIDIDYHFGVAGIDNRIAYKIHDRGIEIINPSLTIKTYHYHLSERKGRSEKVPPPHKFINPCHIHKLPAKPKLLHYAEKPLSLHGFNYKHIREEHQLLEKADIILTEKPISPELLKQISATVIEKADIGNTERISIEKRIYQMGQITYPKTIPQVRQIINKPDKGEARQARIKENQADIQFTGYRNKLSILIPTIEQRSFKFQKLLGSLVRQLNQNNLGKLVQVIHIKDRGKEEKTYYSIGKKRNDLMDMSNGEYIVWIDDDDLIHDEYIRLNMEALSHGKDCVTFNGQITFKGGKTFPYNFSLDCQEYKHVNGVYMRPPGHLTPIKRDIATKFRFKEFSRENDKGSDVMWSLDHVRAKSIKSATHIDKNLYHYLCDPNKKD